MREALQRVAPGLPLLLLVSGCQAILGITETTAEPAEDGAVTAGGAATCGNGQLDLDEQCDDGNALGADGCSAICRWEPVRISAGGQQSCAIGANGVAKCWGDNRWGELGLWDLQNRGDEPGEMQQLPPIDLGTGRLAVELATGYHHTCVLRDDGSVKCWMGTATGPIPVIAEPAPGRVARRISAGRQHTCVVLEPAGVVCWGANGSGQLGTGDVRARDLAEAGTDPGLRIVDLGTAVPVQHLALGGAHSCALLEDGTLRCWGANGAGQLGLGDRQNRGTSAQQMGEALPPVELGPVRAVAVAAGERHTCAILEDGAVKCWGDNGRGQLGLGDTVSRGGNESDMRELPVVDLGGDTARMLALGMSHSCALLADGAVRCWGLNDKGQLGLGDTDDRLDARPVPSRAERDVDLGPGRRAEAIVAGTHHTCVLLDDHSIRCWGYNASGQLGQGDMVPRGIARGQLGDALPPVPIEF